MYKLVRYFMDMASKTPSGAGVQNIRRTPELST